MDSDHTKQLLRKPRAPKLRKIELESIRNGRETPPNSQWAPEDDSDVSSTVSSIPSPLFGKNDGRAGSTSSNYTQDYAINKVQVATSIMPSITFQNDVQVLNTDENQNPKPVIKSHFKMRDYKKFGFGCISSASLTDPDKEAAYNYKSFASSASNSVKRTQNIKLPLDTQQLEAQSILKQYRFGSVKSIVKPSKPSGPDPLPKRYLKHLDDRTHAYCDLTYNEEHMHKPNGFTLNDFLQEAKPDHYYQASLHTKPLVSSYNYKQICKILETKINQEQNQNSDKIHINTLVPELEDFQHRIPLKQIVIEMASFLKHELSEKIGINLKAKFNPISKWQKLQGAHTEIVVYEDTANKKTEPEIEMSSDDMFITPAHLAILDALIRDGLALSLKAFFIDQLPDVSPLQKTLIYFNLSFNNFQHIPVEIFAMVQLEALKLRNNPIKTIPNELGNLQSLKVLILSYCQIENELPDCVFALASLIHLDVSYNSLKHISRLIVNLSNLKYFNAAGNELQYLPATMLQMPSLEKINVKNNYMHPLIWKDLNRPAVQRLNNMAKLQIYKTHYINTFAIINGLSKKINNMLKDIEMCEQCGGPRFGNELKSIRPCLKAFGVKYVPFMFECCSQECFYAFKKKNSNTSEQSSTTAL